MQPVASRESFIPVNANGGTTVDGEEVDAVICSRSTQEKRLRKTSMVCSYEWSVDTVTIPEPG